MGLLKVVVYGLGGAAVLATLGVTLIGIPLGITIPVAAVEIVGCAYLLVRLT